jgi:hypothetical protein
MNLEDNIENKILEVHPTIIMPNRDFLIGFIYGFNSGRKFQNDLKPVPPIADDHEASRNDFYLGYWLECDCIKCKRRYCFNSPVELPTENLICETENCGNHIIVYGVNDSKQCKLGKITLH